MTAAGDGARPAGGRAADLFAAALDQPHERREAFLDEACGGDVALRADVASLLRALPAARRLFDGAPHLPADAADGADPAADPALGLAVGPWRLVRRLAVGGMGAVYLGERVDTAFRKQVAIKLIRPWLDTADIVERFRRERQVLADLEHPHIARLLDGGTTADGLPYLVMEYVDGAPIDRHADQASLTVAERLRLFLTVCTAVQYAHRNLVIHRDLKPSNILVDREGQVKLLDFGIAKVLGGEAGDAADPEWTLPAAMTPRYASPEQMRGERVTTATDVYSLGVLLYELLAGAPPYDVPTRLTATAAQVICEAEPTRPSRAAALAAVGTAASRGQSPPRLAQALAGDLDTIVLKALRKEPERRYASVDELAADIGRHLDGLPVLAAPDRLGYRAGKFLRRHRALAVATTMTVAALAIALGVSLESGRRARQQTREARQLAYVNSLAAAESALRENAVEEAAARLDAAPADLRGWEWRHLSSRLDHSLLTVPAHAQGVTCVRFLPGGASVLTAATDGTVREWDATTGAALRSWGPLGASVESLALPADGSWLAAGLGNGRVMVLDRAAQVVPVQLCEGSGWASVAVGPDGRRLATAHADGIVRVWDVAGRRLLASWEAGGGFVQVAWVPGGDDLVTGDGHGVVKVWDAATGRLRQSFSRHSRRVYCLAVSPDGCLAVSGGMDQLAIVYDLRAGEAVTTFHVHTGTVSSLAFTADSAQVLSSGPDGRFLRWDARTGAVLAELRGHLADVSAVGASPDGHRLASADWNGTLKTWDAEACDVAVRRVPTASAMVGNVGCLAIDPAGRVVACGHSQDGVPVWPLPGSSVMPALLEPTGPVTSLGYTPDGRRLLVGTAPGTLMLFDTATRTIVTTAPAHDGELAGLAVHPSGRWAATGGDDGVIRIWELDDKALKPLVSPAPEGPGGKVYGLAFSPDGTQLAAAAADSSVYLWRWPELGAPRRLEGHAGPVLEVCFDPAGRRLVSAGAEGTLREWSLPDGRLLAARELGRAHVGALAWSRDGSRLASGGVDGVVRLFDAASLRELVGLRGHVARVTALEFAPGDSSLVSGSRDGTLRLWAESRGR